MNDPLSTKTLLEPYDALYNRVYCRAIQRGSSPEVSRERAMKAVEKQRATDARWTKAIPGDLRG